MTKTGIKTMDEHAEPPKPIGLQRRLLLPCLVWAAGEYIVAYFNSVITIIYLIALYGFVVSASASLSVYLESLWQEDVAARRSSLLICAACMTALTAFYTTTTGHITGAYDAPIRLLAMGIFLDLTFFPVLKRLWKQR